MSKEPLREKTDCKKAVNGEMLAVFIISIIAFAANTAVWAFDIGVPPKDVAAFDFGVLFFLVSFHAAGRLRTHK